MRISSFGKASHLISDESPKNRTSLVIGFHSSIGSDTVIVKVARQRLPHCPASPGPSCSGSLACKWAI